MKICSNNKTEKKLLFGIEANWFYLLGVDKLKYKKI